MQTCKHMSACLFATLFALALTIEVDASQQCMALVKQKRISDPRPLVVFVHQHKAGGSTLKGLFYEFAAAYNLRFSIEGLHEPQEPLPEDFGDQLDQYDIVNGHWGYCDLVGRPCYYITNLREPVERAFSFYRYCCIKGDQDCRHLWKPEWTSCDLTVSQWFEHACRMNDVNDDFSGCVGLLRRLSRSVSGPGPSAACYSAEDVSAEEAAHRNLFSPCTRFVLAESLEAGMQRVFALLKNIFVENRYSEYGAQGTDLTISFASRNTNDVGKDAETDEGSLWLTEHSRIDVNLYHTATMLYNSSWSLPLVSC